MPSLMATAKERLNEAFRDESRAGIVLVAASPSVKRLGLLAWALDEFAGDPDPSDPFNALYVCGQPQLLERMRDTLRRIRYRSTRTNPNDLVISRRATTLPPLREFNYASLRVVQRFSEAFPTGLDLVVLDAYHPGEMDELAPFIARVQPLLTIVAMRRERERNTNNPWKHFGKPVVLRGPAQTPPAALRANPSPR